MAVVAMVIVIRAVIKIVPVRIVYYLRKNCIYGEIVPADFHHAYISFIHPEGSGPAVIFVAVGIDSDYFVGSGSEVKGKCSFFAELGSMFEGGSYVSYILLVYIDTQRKSLILVGPETYLLGAHR